jgi:hypothetical protein
MFIVVYIKDRFLKTDLKRSENIDATENMNNLSIKQITTRVKAKYYAKKVYIKDRFLKT